MNIRKHVLVVSLVSAAGCPALALADPVYSVTFLPPGFTGADMNNSGTIVGSTQENESWIWADSGIVNLSRIVPGIAATAINNRGEVAGAFSLADSPAFIYSHGQIRNIGRVAGLNYAIPHAINDKGEVAGTAGNFPGYTSRAFFYSGGTMTALPTFGGDQGDAWGLNNKGQVVGNAAFPSPPDSPRGESRAFLYQDGDFRQLYAPGGGVLGAVYDINDAGTLGLSPAGWARGINNDGAVVGILAQPNSDLTHAYLYADGTTADLNDLIAPQPGWTITEAEDINDVGQILGKACFGSTMDCRAVRLDLVPAIPEPTGLAMLLGGLFSLAAFRRRRA